MFLSFFLFLKPVMSDHGLLTTVAYKLGRDKPAYYALEVISLNDNGPIPMHFVFVFSQSIPLCETDNQSYVLNTAHKYTLVHYRESQQMTKNI